MANVQPLPIDVLIANMKIQNSDGTIRKPTDEEMESRRKSETWSRFAQKIGKRYEACSFENFNAGDAKQSSVVVALREFGVSFQKDSGKGVIFIGPRGTGKDHLAIATIRQCLKTLTTTIDWVDGQSLFSEFRDRIGNDESEGHRIRQLIAPSILLVSDPAPQDGKLSDYQQGILWQIIDARYRRMQTTMITANATSEADLCSKMGAQLVDRLVSDALVVSTAGWKSHRKPTEIVKG